MRHGNGQHETAHGDIHLGEWDSDKFHGKGLLLASNGIRFDGEWENGNFKKGKGIEFNENGDNYEGEFEDGKKHGKGSVYEKGFNRSYTGDWVKG